MAKVTHSFSPSRDSWYASHLQYNDLPDDLVEATDKQWHARLENPDCVVTVEDGKLKVTAPAALSLDELKRAKINELRASYQVLKAAPVKYKTAEKHQALFSNTADDRVNIASVLKGGEKAWSANLWLDVEDNIVTPFTWHDVHKLHDAMHAPHPYQRLLLMIKEVNAATTPGAVSAFKLL